MYAFDWNVHEIQYGKKCSSTGTTLPFEKLIENINEKTNDFLVNVIITDGEMDSSESEIAKLIKKINGIVIFITNNQNDKTFKKLSEKFKNKLYYILADSDFKIS